MWYPPRVAVSHVALAFIGEPVATTLLMRLVGRLDTMRPIRENAFNSSRLVPNH
jgi:hypothetical protein